MFNSSESSSSSSEGEEEEELDVEKFPQRRALTDGGGKKKKTKGIGRGYLQYELTSNLGLVERQLLKTVNDRVRELELSVSECSTCDRITYHAVRKKKKGYRREKPKNPEIKIDSQFCRYGCKQLGVTAEKKPYNRMAVDDQKGAKVRRQLYRIFFAWIVRIYQSITKPFGAFMTVASLALLMGVNQQVPVYIRAAYDESGGVSGIVTPEELKSDIVNWSIYTGILLSIGAVMITIQTVQWIVYQWGDLKRRLKRQRFEYLESKVLELNPFAPRHTYDYWSDEEENTATSDPDCAHLNFTLDEAEGRNAFFSVSEKKHFTNQLECLPVAFGCTPGKKASD